MKDQTFYSLLDQIGHRLTELRKSKGYTSHEDFARDFDLPRIQYWRLEKGKANFTIFTLMRILAIHNLSTIQFFNSIEGFNPKPVKVKRGAEKSELIIKDKRGTSFLEDARL
jgi:transcriptional regulator with XRE-family HTH domain